MIGSGLNGAAIRAAAFAVLGALLASCAAPRLRPDAERMSILEQREQILLAHQDWSLRGRMAISGPGDSASGSIEWTQHGEVFQFTLSAPVSGKTWTLSGDNQQAQLSGLHAQPVIGRSATEILGRELGWKVPIADLAYWVRGIRAPGKAEVVFAADGLPLELRQAGWAIEFRDYERTNNPVLPRRIFAGNGEYKVRLVIQHWDVP